MGKNAWICVNAFWRGPSEKSQEMKQINGLRRASRWDHLIIYCGQNVWICINLFWRGPSEKSQEMQQMHWLRRASREDHLIIIFGQNVWICTNLLEIAKFWAKCVNLQKFVLKGSQWEVSGNAANAWAPQSFSWRSSDYNFWAKCLNLQTSFQNCEIWGKMFESADEFFGRGPSEKSQEMLQIRRLCRASRGDNLIIIFGQNVWIFRRVFKIAKFWAKCLNLQTCFLARVPARSLMKCCKCEGSAELLGK